jgi:hypothetical protein
MTVTITDFRPKLEVEQILEGQGIDPNRARPLLFEEAEKVLEEVHTLIEPLAMYDIVPVEDFHHQTIVMAGGASFEGPLAARALAGARALALAVCTIGPALEERINQLFGEEPVRAMALDGAGVAALSSISKATVARIREEAEARQWGSGMRAQPGQEGWSIWQQRVLFDQIPADEIGVRLTDSALMIPRKSVSFVIGIGPDMRPDSVACDFCSKRERCSWRVDNNDK